MVHYPSQQNPGPQATGGALSQTMRTDMTLRQNIDAKIGQAKKRLAELEAAKERMKSLGILDMRIDDIAHAISS